MTNREMAEAHLRQAQEILLEAQGLMGRGVWNLVVRRAQEAVELALKAALRAVGVEVPKIHDVGTMLEDYAARFPAAAHGDVGRLASISRRLTRERELSFYGDEAAGAVPQRLYTSEDAQQAIQEATFTVQWCGRLLADPW